MISHHPCPLARLDGLPILAVKQSKTHVKQRGEHNSFAQPLDVFGVGMGGWVLYIPLGNSRAYPALAQRGTLSPLRIDPSPF